ncbi:unnamed protein product [Rangifer tarandus platyrhynchus]|uniref:Uncharacterized protein n=1 Tax=Rangifer tarandus platyrhynchus TaxID=3082113 RepID=A0ACB1MMC0_RANTA
MWPLEPMEHPQWRRSELESDLQIEPAAFKALFSSEKPKPEDENLIFFCQMGKRGLQATQVAQSLGYEGARNYEDTSHRAPNMTLGIRKLRLVFPSARLQTSLSCPDPWKVTLWLFTAKVKIPGRRDFD